MGKENDFIFGLLVEIIPLGFHGILIRLLHAG
ncbi:hypothetical protein T4B_6387 [Trichinella pseudospiralis]|uniref:Uncharacterized protein n=1 Tax=Trichinella pseudospiralis TaxID=6337 RepID=A0A0V1GGC8_TRIPS|nr:hypothetical protein T4B_6387 [Trichinella pseudospiralis]